MIYDTIEPGMVAFLIITGIVAVIVFLVVFFSVLNKKKNERVLATSPYIKEIQNINKRYVFKSLQTTYETKTFHLNSKRAFDTFDLYKKRNGYIEYNLSFYQQVVQKINYNIALNNEYRKELASLKVTNDEELAKDNKMSLDSYNKRETKLGSKLEQHPQMSYILRIQWEYTSPAGRNHYSNYRDFQFVDIKNVVGQYAFRSETSVYVTPSQNKPRNPSNSQNNKKVITADDIEDVE